MRNLSKKFFCPEDILYKFFIRITDNALIACATLSNRYISDRYLPDKANFFSRFGVENMRFFLMESQPDFITFRVAAFVLRRQRKEILVPDADTDALLVAKVLENIHADA